MSASPVTTASTTRAFHLGDVLSITTGRLVSPRHMEGVYDILGFMTGESLFTHQLPRACRECAPLLLAHYPALADIEVPARFEPEDVVPWLAEQAAKFGEALDVRPMTTREPQYDTPIGDLVEMVGAEKVLVVEP